MLFPIDNQSQSLAWTPDLLISTSVQKLTLGLKLRNCILKGKVCHYLGKGLLTLATGPSVTLSFGNYGYSSQSVCISKNFPMGLLLAFIYKMLRNHNIYQVHG